ncbi:S15 peptidase family protein [Mycolicibacterium palauense]|uniref:S15 peptidase family protein n=1 Tax=Mycolicibacterium palauense TaxID=2034511 RepID=UPI001FE7872D|nr:CocE/NonD family hydrolase [Mycolicibacterium palauense]
MVDEPAIEPAPDAAPAAPSAPVEATVSAPPSADAPVVATEEATTEDTTEDTGAASVVSNVIHAVFGSENNSAPTTPADSPLEWTMLAFARRESFGQTANVEPTALAAAQATTEVQAIPQNAPFGWLQQLPVVGPLVVTPIVTLIHQIPLIGDVLHPLIGYPVDHAAPAGTPQARDVKIVSFDGTEIYVHFMPAEGLAAGEKAPTILDGPGLALPGSTMLNAQKDGFLPNDVIGIGTLRDAGYNVVTWDPRGEWHSGGQLEIDSPDFEGRDVSAIISWVAAQPEAQLDSLVDLDPRLGMVGASYGGGIQLASAAIDDRIDAIVPTIAWHSLNSSLYKNEAFKSSWGTFLSAGLILTLARTNPRLIPAAIYGDLTTKLKESDQELLAERGPGDLVDNITAPTLLVQGTVDTLFTLAEADANAQALLAQGVPTKVLWYCGGHGACLSSRNDGVLIRERTLQWLQRYVRGDVTVDTGALFEWVDQHGRYHASDTYPITAGTPVTAARTTAKTIPLFPFVGGSGPQPAILFAGLIQTLVGIPSGAPALNAVNLTLPTATETTYLVGAPELTLTYSGTGTARHVYAQLVDPSSGLVLGNLVTPVPVTLDGQTHTVTVKMEQIAHSLAPGEAVKLQVVASAFPYENVLSLGVLTVSGMQISVPTADPAAVSDVPATATVAAA